jgi:hypothetical protein
MIFVGNTSSIHPLDYRTLPEVAEFSVQQSTSTASTVADPTSRDAITNHQINAKRSEQSLKEGGIPWVFPNPTTLAYRLGQDILVHPVMHDADNRTTNAVVEITFPELSAVIPSTKAPAGTVWLDWWHPTDAKRSHKAGETKSVAVTIDNYPVYVRKGAFIPLHPLKYAHTEDRNKGLSEEALMLDYDTSVTMDRVLFTWFAPSPANDATHPVTFSLRESISEGTGMVATAAFSSANTLSAQISAHTGALGAGFAFVGVTEPAQVTVDAWPNARCLHEYAKSSSTLTVSCDSVVGGVKVTATGVAPTL